MSIDAIPKRADAVRNRERVLAAAVAVFAERGIEASVPDVAARAGVGKATVYRSFPTKEHLVAAVVLERMEEFERRARALLDEPDAWAALSELMSEKAVEHCVDRTLASALQAGVSSDLLDAARQRLWGAVEALMERAKAQGRMRETATSGDLRVLWGGAARMLAADGVNDPDEWRRYAALALDALRA
ncbi:MAG TPA: helix-turn-helix domain-containing protein [Solirubrobacteraceae bacterium]|nr:helix-turn-helix domain-containing protein [Solirubrobacteraceae bacterium]